MTFLNPFLLLGLAAAAIPILIHLLNLRRLKTVEFSSLRFLKELQQTSIRRLKVRQILLLLLRTLLVIAVVLAFSRPALRGSLSGPVGSRAASTIILAVDDSPSMTVRNEQGLLLDQARTAAGRLLELAHDGDEIHLIRLSDIRYAETFPAAYNVESVRSALTGLTPSEQRVSFREAAGVIARILSETRNINREVYYISDEQAGQFIVEAKDSADLFDERTRFFFVRIPGPSASVNVGIGAMQSAAQILSPDKPFSLDVLVQNTGTAPVTDAQVSVHLDGRRVTQQAVDLPPSRRSSVSFTLTPQRPGRIAGYVQLEDDLFDADNRRYFAIDVPEQIRVGLVGTGSSTAFPRLALSAVRQIGGEALFSIQQIDEAGLSSFDGAGFDLLVFCDLPGITVAEGERVADFVTGGGGLAIFPGRHTDIGAFNQRLFRRLEVPAVMPASGEIPNLTNEKENIGFVSFGKIDLGHPLFAGLFEETPGGTGGKKEVESPRIFRTFGIRGRQGDNTLIELSDATPFLIEFTRGAGKLFLFAVDPEAEWSDFPYKALYAPLLHRSAVYLATGREASAAVYVGEPVTFTLRERGAPGAEFILKSPSGMTGRIIPRLDGATGLSSFISPPTREAGIYELRESGDRPDGKPLALAAVNIDPAESEIRTLSDSERETSCGLLGIESRNVQVLAPSEEMTATILESRFGIELWKYLAGLAFLLAIGEMLVARATRRDLGTAVQQ